MCEIVVYWARSGRRTSWASRLKNYCWVLGVDSSRCMLFPGSPGSGGTIMTDVNNQHPLECIPEARKFRNVVFECCAEDVPEDAKTWSAHFAEDLGADSIVLGRLLLELGRSDVVKGCRFSRKPSMSDILENPTLETLFSALWKGSIAVSSGNDVNVVGDAGAPRVHGQNPKFFPPLVADDGYTLTQPFCEDMFQRCPFQRGAEFLHNLMENSARCYPEEPALRVARTSRTTNTSDASRENRAVFLHALGLDGKDLGSVADVQNLFELNYQNFNAMSNRLAERIDDVLCRRAAPEEFVADGSTDDLLGDASVVAVLVPRTSVLPFVGQMGVFKAGGVVLPLDPMQPTDVLAFPIQDSSAKVVLTLEAYIRKTHPDLLDQLADEVVFLDFLTGRRIFRTGSPAPSNDPDCLPDLRLLSSVSLQQRLKDATDFRPNCCGSNDPADRLAYLFYTSGSTGRPKGCLVAHGSYMSGYLTYQNIVAYQTGFEVFGNFQPLAFDGSLDSLYPAWINALPIVIVTEKQVRSGVDMVDLIRAEGITSANVVPTLLGTITPDPDEDLPLPLFSKVSCGGEAVSPQLVAMWTKNPLRSFRNAYGPTEVAVTTSQVIFKFPAFRDDEKVRLDMEVPIGYPNCGITCAIMRRAGEDAGGSFEPVPYGEQGELCVTGCQLAKGYLNLPEKTAESFPHFKSETIKTLVGVHANKRWLGREWAGLSASDRPPIGFRPVSSAVSSAQSMSTQCV